MRDGGRAMEGWRDGGRDKEFMNLHIHLGDTGFDETRIIFRAV